MKRYIRTSFEDTMYIRIYQINSDRDLQLYYDTKDSDSPKGRIMFESYDSAKKYGWDESLYDLVWEGRVPIGTLDMVYEMFGNNYEGTMPDDFKGHSLSMSDVIVMDNHAFYCDRFGWTTIPFNTYKAKQAN